MTDENPQPNEDGRRGDSEIFTLQEAVEWLKLRQLGYADPVKTLKRWAARGKIPHHILGGRKVVFTLEDLRGFAKPARNNPSRPPTAQRRTPADQSRDPALCPGATKLRLKSGRTVDEYGRRKTKQ